MSLFERERYSVEYAAGSDVAVLRGVMRLATPAAYDALFGPLRTLVESGRPSTVDLSEVSFLNSSGIRALASVVLLAKERGTPLQMITDDSIPWQKKTLASFRSISPSLRIAPR